MEEQSRCRARAPHSVQRARSESQPAAILAIERCTK
jgi:hypothetical protein